MIALFNNGVVKRVRQLYTQAVTTIKTKIGALKMPNKKPTIEQMLDQNNVIIGVLLFVAVMSIAFSSYVVWVSTDGLLPKVLLLPQIFLAALICAWKFTRK